MKKTISLVLVIAMTLFVFASCAASSAGGQDTVADSESNVEETADTESTEQTNMRVLALKGPTGMGLTKLIDDNSDGVSDTSNSYTFTLASSADEVTADIIKGDYEAAAVPTNLAAVLYNKTGGNLYIEAVDTLGVLYIIENGNEINTISDLSGKTISITGQGAVPEYVLEYILDANGITDCNIEYYSDGGELATKVISGDVDIAMLPVPYAIKATTGDSGARIALSVTDEFKTASGEDDDSLCQACIIVNKEFADNNEKAVSIFLDECKSSIDYAVNYQDDAAQMMEDNGIIASKGLALASIPYANLVYIDGDTMKNALGTFYKILYESNPDSVGGSIPDNEIYG